MPKIRNIIIFVAIAAVIFSIYVFFVKDPGVPESSLITSPGANTLPGMGDTGVVASGEPAIARDFLTLLLNVKNIKLDDSIFAETAWANLRDSSIVLLPDGTEGRANPFAPFGSENFTPAPVDPVAPTTTTPTTILPATPVKPQ